MAQGIKPPDLDLQGNPIEEQPPDLDLQGNPVTQKAPVQEPTKPEPSWGQTITGGALGTVPAIAGGALGSVFGPVGTAAGGALGGAAGSYLRQKYEIGEGLRKEVNPYVVGTEGAVNAIPFFGKFPGFGAGARSLLGYGAKMGVQGAVSGAIADPLLYKAETGEWDLDPSRIGKSAAVGGVMAPTLSMGAHALLGRGHASIPRDTPNAGPSRPSRSPISEEPITPKPNGTVTRLTPEEVLKFRAGSIDATAVPEIKPKTNRKATRPVYDNNPEVADWERFRDEQMGMGQPDPGPYRPDAIPPSRGMVPYKPPPVVKEGGDTINTETGEVLDLPLNMKDLFEDEASQMGRSIYSNAPENRPTTYDPEIKQAIDRANQPSFPEGRYATVEESPEYQHGLAIETAHKLAGKSKDPNAFSKILNQIKSLPIEVLRDMHEGKAPPPSTMDTRPTFGPKDPRTPLMKGSLKDITNRKLWGSDKDVSSMAVGEGNKIKMGIGDTKSMIRIFRNTYKENGPAVAGKELIQNAIDATHHLGQNAKVDIEVDPKAGTLTVSDNGAGLTREQLETVFTDLSSSGKRGTEGFHIGEMGAGKTTYLVGGDKVRITTIAKEADGTYHRYTFGGTPEEIMEGVDIKDEVLSPEEMQGGTGTLVEFTPTKGSDFHSLNKYIRHLSQYSNIDVPLTVHGVEHADDIYAQKPWNIPAQSGRTEGKVIGQGETDGTKFKITVPEGIHNNESNVMKAVLVNRGMFQGVDTLYFNQKSSIPDHIIVELDPKVDALDKKYPLTAPVRDSMEWNTKYEVQHIVQKEIIEGSIKRRQEELGRIFKQLMPKKGERYSVADAEGKYLPSEIEAIKKNPALNEVMDEVNSIVREFHRIPELNARTLGDIVTTGWILDEQTRGMNVRNPNNHKEYAIFFNPHTILESANGDPRKAANAFIHVAAHEYTHMIARSEDKDFTSALADVYTHFDIERQLNARTRIEQAISAKFPNSGGGVGYDTEIQKLLQDRKAIIGRAGSGTNAAIAEGASHLPVERGTEKVSGGNRSNGKRVSRGPTKAKILNDLDEHYAPDDAYKKYASNQEPLGPGETWRARVVNDIGSGDGGGRVPPKPRDHGNFAEPPEGGKEVKIEQTSKARQAWEFLRELKSADIPYTTSAAWRQAAPLVGTKAWRRALLDSVKSYHSEEYFNKVQEELQNSWIHRPKRVGKKTVSLAAELGLARTNPTHPTYGEEKIKTNLAESLPGLAGRYFRASNRSFIAFMDSIRTHTAEDWLEAMRLEDDNVFDMVKAKKLVNVINELTGHGAIGFYTPGARLFTKNPTFHDFNQMGQALSEVFWTPRQLARDARMMNPMTYMNSPELDRKQYLLGALRRASVWAGFTGLMSILLGAKVERNPRSSDFGKAKIKNTRLDAGSGTLQFATLIAREITGKSTSSSSGRTTELGSSPVARTREQILYDFLRNRVHPSARQIIEPFAASKDKPYYFFSQAFEAALPFYAADMLDLYLNDAGARETIMGLLGATTSMGSMTYGPRDYGKPDIPFPKDVIFKGGDPTKAKWARPPK